MWQYFDIATQIRAFEKCSFIKPPTSNKIPKVAILHIKMIFVQLQIEGLNPYRLNLYRYQDEP